MLGLVQQAVVEGAVVDRREVGGEQHDDEQRRPEHRAGPVPHRADPPAERRRPGSTRPPSPCAIGRARTSNGRGADDDEEVLDHVPGEALLGQPLQRRRRGGDDEHDAADPRTTGASDRRGASRAGATHGPRRSAPIGDAAHEPERRSSHGGRALGCGRAAQSSVGVPDEQGDLRRDDGDAGQQHPRPEDHAEGGGGDAGGEGQRAEAGRRVDADDAGRVGGVGIGASSGRGGRWCAAPVPRPAGDEPAERRWPSAAARRRPGHRRRAQYSAPITREVDADARPQHHLQPHGGHLVVGSRSGLVASRRGSPGTGGAAPCESWSGGRQPRPAATSGCSLQRRSNTGRSERIGGSHVKLCSGGGDDVAHSSELACHGSAPAVGGCAQRAHDVDGERDERQEQHHRADRGDHVPALELVDSARSRRHGGACRRARAGA